MVLERHRASLEASLVDAVQQAVIATDLEGRVLFWNLYAAHLFGWTEQEALGHSIVELTPHDSTRAEAAAIMGRLAKGESWAGEFPVRRKDGSSFIAFVVDSPIFDSEGKLAGVVGVSTDVSQVRALEAQLRQAQKMEAVGRLAGGIAHDFNNLLTVVIGNLDLMQNAPSLGPPYTEILGQIREAANRAAGLTRQLLAFSRKQLVRPQVLDLTGALRALQPMLGRLISENVAVRFDVPEKIVHAVMDPGQFDQLVLNLVLNARDAMPGGGALTLRLGVDPALPGADGVIHLTVTDTGVGIPPEALPHIFEPFFTTKGVGSGTGLGLATVYSIVEQAGARIEVESAEGKGSTFHVVLPLASVSAASPRAIDVPALGTARGATVLVVEDEPSVRTLVARILSRDGYQVLTASAGDEALTIVRSHAGPVDVLLTDVLMPGINGFVLAEQVSKLRPGIGVVHMTGHIDDAVLKARGQGGHPALLQKPFTSAELLHAVHEAQEAVQSRRPWRVP
jgi:two-component system cell cycle sensor histidine kinase/response regulator CckA